MPLYIEPEALVCALMLPNAQSLLAPKPLGVTRGRILRRVASTSRMPAPTNLQGSGGRCFIYDAHGPTSSSDQRGVSVRSRRGAGGRRARRALWHYWGRYVQ